MQKTQYDDMGLPESREANHSSSKEHSSNECQVVGKMELPEKPQRPKADKHRVFNFNTPIFVKEDGTKTKQAKDVHAAINRNKKGNNKSGTK